MSLVNLPSVKDAKTLEDVINAVENMRKEVEFLLNNVQNDNINGVITAGKLQIGPETLYTDGYDPSAVKKAANDYTDGMVAGVQTQVDGKIETWFYSGAPTLSNTPTSTWATTTDKDKHLGDLYFDTATGKTYRFKKAAAVYSWELVQDTDIQTAMTNASTAKDTADGKRRIFTSVPVPPYDVGDLWAQGATGDLLRCKTPKGTGGAYSSTDWEQASKYTDDVQLKTDLRMTAPLPTSITMDSNGITASTSDATKYARLDYRGLYIVGGALQIVGGLSDGQIANSGKWNSAGTKIDANGIYTGTLNANQITAGTITGNFINGGVITGADWMSATTGTPFNVYIGNSSNKAMVVYNGSLHLYYTDIYGVAREYFSVHETDGVKFNGAAISGTAKFG